MIGKVEKSSDDAGLSGILFVVQPGRTQWDWIASPTGVHVEADINEHDNGFADFLEGRSAKF